MKINKRTTIFWEYFYFFLALRIFANSSLILSSINQDMFLFDTILPDIFSKRVSESHIS